jgi:tetratricopeptide (TPR) repeat protein
MRAHLDAGNRQAAMRQFERLRDALHRELGVGPDPQTVALYEDILALEGTEPSTPAERAAAHLSAGLVALSRMDLEEAERQARLARGLAIEAGTAREVGEASGLLGMVAHSRSSWPDLFLEEFELVVQDTPDVAGTVFDAHLCLAEFSLLGKEGPEAIATYAHQLLEIAERFDSLPGRALARLILGESKLIAGDLEGAEENLSQAAQLHSEAGAASGRTLAVLRLAEVALATGQHPRARRLVADAHALALGSSLESHLLVRAYGEQVQAAGDPAAAAEQALSARDDLEAREVCPPCSIGFLVASAIACARALRGGDASGFLEQAERAAGMWQGGPWLAAVWEARAELRLAVGEGRQAAAFFREAADLFARSGHRLAEARCNSASERSSGLGRPGNARGTSHS